MRKTTDCVLYWKWILRLFCILVAISLLGCSEGQAFPAQPAQSQPQWPQQPQQQWSQQPQQPQQLQSPQPQWPQQQQPQQPQWPQQPTAFNPVGIWVAEIPTDYGPMYTQMILQPNGSYSYQVVWGNLMTYEVGLYEVGQGFIHFAVQDYEPKEYKGQPQSRPTSWTVFYTVVDANTMIWEDRVLGTRWTVYRQGQTL